MKHRSKLNSPLDETPLILAGQRLDSALAHVRAVVSDAGIPDASVEARSLLRAALGINREALLTDRDRLLTEENRAVLESLVNRRARREPLQYIIGPVEFYGRRFEVDPRVLIPRPETELLIEQVLAFSTQRGLSNARVLDIGTGSGVIAVTLAAELSGLSIVATDISGDALDVAMANAVLANVEARIEFIRCSLATEVTGTFDVVVCNPPYVQSAFLSGPDVQPELAYEPQEALDGGRDGMKVYRPLLGSLRKLLAPGGAAFIEIDPPVVSGCVEAAKRSLPEASVSVLTDLAGLERCLMIELPH
jgi:release factor glutamine methyltransferase